MIKWMRSLERACQAVEDFVNTEFGPQPRQPDLPSLGAVND